MPHTAPPSTAQWRNQLALCAAVFTACLIGIYSRPIAFLATFWPANALLLGLLLRNKRLAMQPSTWGYAGGTYLLADLLTGASVPKALWLNLANMAAVLAGWCYLSRHSDRLLRFQHPRSVPVFFLGSLLASMACAAVGAPASVQFFDVPLGRAAVLWLFSEFYGYALILPLVLTAPRHWPHTWPWRGLTWNRVLPIFGLLAVEICALPFPDLDVMAFTMPAMIWCAMSYRVFPVSVLSLLVCSWKLGTIGTFSFTPPHIWDMTSFRTGLALLSSAPLAVACMYNLRQQALDQLRHAVHHDFLTQALTRHAFGERASLLLERMQREQQPYAVLMLDLDHFKQVNDTYGHAQGDHVLQQFARLVQHQLRAGDLLCRLGGEEFAALLPHTDAEHARTVAQRLCEAVRHTPILFADHTVLHITVSIGVSCSPGTTGDGRLAQCLEQADKALYRAKAEGRNRIAAWT